MDLYTSSPRNLEWKTVEEFHEKYNTKTTPELLAKRASIQDKLSAWGFLLREGLIDIESIVRAREYS